MPSGRPADRGATGTVRSRRGLALAATALLASALSALYQSPGVVLSPDSWAYWESSVSLLRGEGYCYFGGQPITLWPPLFPLYLAAWQALGGALAGTIAVAQAAALGGAAAAWGYLLCRRAPIGWSEGIALPTLASLLAFAQREIGSESLYMALLGIVLVVATAPATPSAEPGRETSTLRWIALTLLLGILLLTRNAAFALLPSVLLVAIATDCRTRRRAIPVLLLAICTGVAAAAIWSAVRAALGQTESHPLRLPDPARSLDVARGLLMQLVETAGPRALGIGGLLFAGHVALSAALGIWLVRREDDRSIGTAGVAAGRLLFFAAIALLGFAVLVPIASPLETRFGRFALLAAPLLAIVPALVARSKAPRALIVLACALLLAIAGVQAWRASFWISRALRGPEPGGLGWSTCLDPRGTAADCVTPPDFGWIDRHYRKPDAAAAGHR